MTSQLTSCLFVCSQILRNHIMVRVGGGWDTLQNYLNKHDPCRSMAVAGGAYQTHQSNLASSSGNSFSTNNLNNNSHYLSSNHHSHHHTGMY